MWDESYNKIPHYSLLTLLRREHMNVYEKVTLINLIHKHIRACVHEQVRACVHEPGRAHASNLRGKGVSRTI